MALLTPAIAMLNVRITLGEVGLNPRGMLR